VSPASGGEPTRARRAFVLIAVMVLVGSALLIATGLVFMAQAETAGLATTRDAAGSRALAWSGVQAVIAELDGQRDRLLDSELPRLEEQYVLIETPGRLGVVRLLPVTPDGANLAPEAGKLDVNAVDADGLVATGLADRDLAAAIVAHRDGLGRPLQSIGELLEVPGMTPELLYGPVEALRWTDDAALDRGDLLDRVADRLAGDELRGLADLLTVYAFEPALQRNGRKRINLNVPWSEELGRRVDERFGPGASSTLKGIFDAGTRFDGAQVIFEVLNQVGSPPADWPEIIDALTTDDGDYHFGRLDINTAPYEALLGLPEVTPEQATQIVQARDELDAETRTTVAWPAIEEILPAEAYEQLGGRITTRSWTFRVRLAAGEVDDADPEGPLLRPVIYEAVIDCSAPQARLAYLRDVTLMQTTAMLAMQAAAEGLAPEADEPRFDEDEPDDEEAMPDDDLDPETAGEEDDGFGPEPMVTPETPRAPETPRVETPRAPATPRAGADEAEGRGGAGSADGGAGTSAPARRRIGRWQSG
jgi:DNA uptake protein ComE-like DNA-binding protein